MTTIRMAPATLLAAMVLAAVPAPVALADRVDPADGRVVTPCRVRNVTQDTRDRSFRRMVTAAHNGDRLRVRGTCSGGVTIRKSLIIEGVGPDATLSGRGRFRVLQVMVKLGSHQETHVRIRNLRIVRGTTTSPGGGIRVYYARLTLTDSVVTGNIAGGGGGIAVDEGEVTLRRSVVRGNTASGYGGGLWAVISKVTLIDSVVRDNHAAGAGGIADNGVGIVTLIDSSIRRNTAEGPGGGILTESSSSLWMRGSSVAGNTAGTDGGGIWNMQSDYEVVELVGSTVTGNTAGRHGGGLYIETEEDPLSDERSATLADSMVSGNHAGVDGGGIYAVADPILVVTGSSVVTGNDPNDCAGTPAC